MRGGGKPGPACELRFKVVKQDCPGTVDGELLDDGPRNPAAGENRRVLRLRDEQANLLTLAAASDEAEIVGLGAAAREHDVLRRSTDQGCNLRARPLDERPRLAALRVNRGGVAGHGQGSRHRGCNLRAERRAGITIEIEAGRVHRSRGGPCKALAFNPKSRKPCNRPLAAW
jgi:hypothetical protein